VQDGETDPGGEREGEDGTDDSVEILRAKYHDYCSAQLADLLLYLSPDEIYLLAEKASRSSDREAGDSYEDIVRQATEWLSDRVVLPPFDVWAEDYRAHPDRYEAYFMGLWRSVLPPERNGH